MAYPTYSKNPYPQVCLNQMPYREPQICYNQSTLYPQPEYIKLPQMFIVSNRHDAWNFSMLTCKEVCLSGLMFSSSIQNLNNKKILILVGGYTSQEADILPVLCKTAFKTKKTYDAIIAYSYPSGSVPFYNQARKVACTAADGLCAIINTFSNMANLDIAAHSMGVHLTLNALNANLIPTIMNLYLLGGAERQESLNACFGPNCTQYHKALVNAHHIYVFATCRDDVLSFHTLLTGEQTLGRPTNWNNSLSERVSIIDTTDVVSGHSDFWTSDAVFKAINFLSNHCLNFPIKAFLLTTEGNLLPNNQPLTCRSTFIQSGGAKINQVLNNFLGFFF